jgi:hypothetical protein
MPDSPLHPDSDSFKVHAPEAHAKGLRLRFVPSRLTASTDLLLLRRALGALLVPPRMNLDFPQFRLH